MLLSPWAGITALLGQRPAVARPLPAEQGQQQGAQPGPRLGPGDMPTDACEQLIDVAAPGGGSYPVQRSHRRGIRCPHTIDAARWPPSPLTSSYTPRRSTTAVLGRLGRRGGTGTARVDSAGLGPRG